MQFLLEQPMLWPIAIPLVAGLVCLFVPESMKRIRPFLAILGTLMTLLATWPLFLAVRNIPRGARLLMDDGRWLCLDHLSSFVLLATAAFGLLIAIYSVGYMADKRNQREYYACLLWTVAVSCGAILANDLVLLLVFWGLLGLALYLMIGTGGAEASAAAKKSFVLIGGTDCLLLVGVILIWLLTGTTRIDKASLGFGGELSYVAFLCFAAAAFAKAGAVPFHTWVPDCGEKAPVSVTAFLPASLDKLLGIYLLARATTSLFRMDVSMNVLLCIVGTATILIGVMMALVQHDLKRLLSYHAVSQVGYMVLGIGTGTAVGIAGGLFHMLNNAIYKSCLFLCAGSVERETGTSDLDRLGGLAKAMPLTFGACLVAAMAISGIPPLNGFYSKWMVYQGLVEMGKAGGQLWVVWLAAAMLGSALTLASFAKVLHAVFLCKPSPEVAAMRPREVGFSMWAPMVVLAALCVVFGVLAARLPIAQFISPAVGGFTFSGTWWAAPATVMLLAAYGFGLVVYWFTTTRKARACDTYIGGEILDDVYVTGETRGEARNVEVTGVDFYRTFEEMAPLRPLYAAARQKFFDIYDVGARTVFYFVEALRKGHTGVLPVYLAWVFAGLVLLLYVLMRG